MNNATQPARYPLSIYRVEFTYDYIKGDPIEDIADALLESPAVTYVEEPIPAFPQYVITVDMQPDSPPLEEIDNRLRAVIDAHRTIK